MYPVKDSELLDEVFNSTKHVNFEAEVEVTRIL
jgi:hypothetical protein